MPEIPLVKSIEQAIAYHAHHHTDALALVIGDVHLSYKQFDEAISKKAKEYGTLDGHAIPFRARACIDAVVAYFAIHRAGGVAVPLDKQMPDSAYTHYVEQLQHTSCPENVADILFTTGTTGQPKGVMVSHRAIVANAENLVQAQGFHPGLTFVVNGPLNHIGSLSKLYPAFLTGGTVSIVDGLKDMDLLFQVIAKADGKVATFLVPASIRLLMTYAADSLKANAERIEMIETGAAPISQSDMEQLCQLLPRTRLYNTYASTETGIIATHNFNEDICVAGCLGRPMRHSSLRIDDNGHVVCSGATLMSGYWHESNDTQQLLCANEIVTNDLGRIDAEGRLLLQGRDDDVINVGGFKVAPSEVEDNVLSHTSVSDCICTSYIHPVIGTCLRLLIVPLTPDFDKKQLYQWLRQRLEAHKLPQDIQVVEKIERTFNGKLNRKFYQR